MNGRHQATRTIVWRGQTPDGYSLLIERESTGHWTATVAAAVRSRSTSLEIALIEAAGPKTPRAWARNLADRLAPEGSDSGLTRPAS